MISQFVARPALTAYSTTFPFNTGSAPGSAIQTGQQCVLVETSQRAKEDFYSLFLTGDESCFFWKQVTKQFGFQEVR